MGVLLHARLPAGVQNCGGIHSQGHCIIFDHALLGDLVRVIIVARFPNAIRLDAAVAASDPAIRERRSQLLRQVVEHLDLGARKGWDAVAVRGRTWRRCQDSGPCRAEPGRGLRRGGPPYPSPCAR